MKHAVDSNLPNQEKPLLSHRHKLTIGAVIGFLALFSITLTALSGSIGQRLLLGNHSENQAPRIITVGLDQLHVEENTIRFERQRHDGPAPRVDLALTWPEMQGYSLKNRLRFDDVSQTSTLIFIQISQSTMSRDMSGRVAPIYRQLFDGPPTPGPFGLTLHHFRAGSGYDGEIFYTAPRNNSTDYAIRCMDAKASEDQSIDDCQRDIHLGKDLSILYRFSRKNLVDWQKIDNAVITYVNQRLVTKAQS